MSFASRIKFVPIAILLISGTSQARRLRAADFIRGDTDNSGTIDVTDPIRIFGFLFLGGPQIMCLDSADADDSGELDLTDGVYLLDFLFRGGLAPSAPFPLNGPDPTADKLTCGGDVGWVHRWNHIAIDASGLDHTPLKPGENRVFGHHLGPGRASRAIAIVHIAMFEAVNAVAGGYQSYVGLAPAPADASLKAAIAQSTHDALVGMFPSQAPIFDAALAEDLATIDDGASKTDGIATGAAAAAAIIAKRANDGSNHPEPKVNVDYIPGDGPGEWRQDPISQHPLALGARWSEVTPFVMTSASQFRVPAPPALDSQDYADAYNEVKRLGGDGETTPTHRDANGSQMGVYWAYDGTPSLCAPPRLYNQIAMQIADEMGTGIVEQARLLVLINVSMADAGIGIWESKYFYKFWRPITGIRESDAGTGPTGLGDGNAATEGDATFTPMGAPASNLNGPNFTPPFPAYPSGHAGFGGALFQTLRRFYGTDDIAFAFISDEFNGMTHDNQNEVRPLVLRKFTKLSQAEEENGQSRIYLGIHWRFDKTEGIAQGRKVADYVFDHLYLPSP